MFGIKRSLYSTSIISISTKLIGNIETDGELQIDGVVEGNINCGKVVIGLTGVVKGVINSQKVIINGSVIGNIYSSSVILGVSSRVNGDIYHNYISIMTGASIEGDLKKQKKLKVKYEDKD